MTLATLHAVQSRWPERVTFFWTFGSTLGILAWVARCFK